MKLFSTAPDWQGAVSDFRRGVSSTLEVCVQAACTVEVFPVLVAAIMDYDRLKAEEKALIDAGAADSRTCVAADERVRVARLTPGTTAEEVAGWQNRQATAVAESKKAFSNRMILAQVRKQLAALESYFPELFFNPDLQISAGMGRVLGILPASTANACNAIGLNPHERPWCEFGKVPERQDTSKPRYFRRIKFLEQTPIQAEAGGERLHFEADGSVSLQALATEGDKPGTFTMVAYSGGLMLPRGFSIPVVADLSTATLAPNPLPVFRNHDPGQIVGHGDAVIRNGQILVERGVISGAGQAAKEVRASAKKSFPWKASIGANPERLEFIEAGKSVTVNGRTFKGPLYVAHGLVVHEVSFVPLAGDSKTSTRVAANRGGQALQSVGLSPADRAELNRLRQLRSNGITGAMEEVRLASLRDGNQTTLDHRKRIAIAYGLNPFTPEEILASTSGLHGFDVLSQLVPDPIIAGFQAAAGDSTLGWTRRVPLPDYRESEIAVVNQSVAVSRIGRGETAAHISLGLTSPAGWKLAKLAVQFKIDEQDELNGLKLQTVQNVGREVGRMFGGLIANAVWALLLSNPQLADGTVLFHSSRGNVGTGGGSALGAASLAAGAAAIGSQTLPVERGGVEHLNLVPKYLVTPPDLHFPARALAKLVNQGDENDLVVRSESRMGTAGVIDPLADDILTGTATNWLMAAPAEQAPSIYVGALDGKFEPTIRSGALRGGGEYGRWFDVTMSIGVLAVDGRGLYWATGA